MTNRRDFVKSLIVGGTGALVIPQLVSARSPFPWTNPILLTEASAEDPWSEAARILARIKPPVFPNRDFKITEHGAVADGSSDSTAAIRKAIEACHAAGGGRVIVSPGVFMTGAIHLKSNVNLYLAEGATLKFATDPAMYLPVVFTRFEGTECLNFSPFIYAFEQGNIAITERGVPVAQRIFGKDHRLRPNFIQPYRCRNVLIESITIRNSPMWEIHPVLSSNVTVRGVKISSHGPNNDGCNPESSRDVLIEDCVFDTGDDCIAIKSGRDNDGRRVAKASENIVIRNCTMKDGHGGVVFGSEVSGNIRNVFVENCHMDSPNLDRAFRFKSNARRGGIVENIFARNVEIGHVAEAVLTIDFLYETGAVGPHRPVVRNVTLEKIKSAASPRGMWIVSFPGSVIEDVRFIDCVFRGVEA